MALCNERLHNYFCALITAGVKWKGCVQFRKEKEN
jgi:hypothetical protein